MKIDREAVRKRVEALKSFPTLPGVFEKMSRLMSDANTTAGEIADVIATDQALSAKVLRLVNSAFYGFPGRISTITHAVIILGSDALKGVIISSSVFDVMLARGLYDLWKHSLGCAVVSGIIARKKDYPDPEEVSVAGLLHDIGKVILKIELPDEFLLINDIASREQISIGAAEEDFLGFDHSDAGSWLSQKWNLPRSLSDPITYHHRPGLARTAQTPTAIVHLADVLIRAIGFGSGGDDMVPQIDKGAWESLDISRSALEEIICESDEKLEDTEIISVDGDSGT